MQRYNFGADDHYLLTHNKLGIDTLEELERAEQYAFMIRALQVETQHYTIENFTKQSFCALHHHLFQDIFTFAGTFRDVQLSKGNTRFCQAQFLDVIADELFEELQHEAAWQTTQQAAARLAYFKAELNMLHPFREGNGRTIRIFLHAYARTKRYEWHYMDLVQDEYMSSMIQSVTNTADLQRILYNTLERIGD